MSDLDPKHISRLLHGLIFQYRAVDKRRDGGSIDMRRIEERPGRPTESPFVTNPKMLGDPCWVGQCPGCGRTLISATWKANLPPDVAWCTRACRERHA